MSQSFRQQEIQEIARRDGKVIVEDLAAHFGVTVQTIRRDLTDMADEGTLDRVHGGALYPSGVSNIEYEERRDLNQDAKSRMARACARAIPDGVSVFINIGTSTEAVANELLSHSNLLVVTNNLNVANRLTKNPDSEVVVTGGSLRRTDGGLVGALATRTIEQFKFDYAVIGCSAVDEDGDLLDFDMQEVTVSQTIIRHARKVLLVADHSKILRSAPARIGSMREIDACYTDRPLPGVLKRKCDEWGTQVVVAG
ncbi:DeoR/GlpR family DNA-binding transcription regulator [Octadecabacter sp. CECT 8868]|uniref:DeoR/GlpR family DNA-binding transcription regulator n=1 Tax=Octadecabacter algicola TaxID=2909342 RepID=UPI001F443FA4|nr:DeoR/GlpR family DNA-binding transcription regulator [Octadecabacter algicola]MCF2905204.1 DeoR/GlpR family DNA-binding transcription regulator [Octadecabacter algicola]